MAKKKKLNTNKNRKNGSVSWGSDVEIERRKRIRLAVYAYAYEFENESLVSDDVYDQLSKEVNPYMDTKNEIMDEFFEEQFEPDTGMWIHKHPELDRIKTIYNDFYSL